MEGHARWEYLQAIHGRYRAAARREKGRILDEFCARDRLPPQVRAAAAQRAAAGKRPAAPPARAP